jgi:hypothetical protein
VTAESDALRIREGESGILEQLSSIARKSESPLERGYGYLRRVFDVDRCYQSILSRTPDFATRIEMPDEVFTSAVIQDALMDSALSPRVRGRVVDFLAASHDEGLFSYFVEKGLLPTDVDTTGLALSVLVRAGAVSPQVAHSATSKVLENVDDAGVIHVYMPPRGEREGRSRVEPIPCANALYLAYLLGRDDEARPTEEYLIGVLREQGSATPKDFYYYLSPDVLLYWTSRLLRFDRFRARYRHVVEDALRARIGTSDNALDLALRVITADSLHIDAPERVALRKAQKPDGSCPIFPIYKLGRSHVYVGSEALVTALALRALGGAMSFTQSFGPAEPEEETRDMDPQAGFGMIQVEGRAEEHGERLSGVELEFPDFDRVRLPDLLFPAHHQISRHLPEVRTAYVDWLVDAKVIEPGTQGYEVLLGMKLDDCSALISGGYGKDIVLYMAVSLALFFMVDDFIDNVSADVDKKLAYIGRLGRIADGEAPVPEDDHIIRAWYRWFKESESYASPALFSVFAEDLKRHVRALRAQTLMDRSTLAFAMTHLMRHRDNIGSTHFMSHGAIFLEHEYRLDMRPVVEDQHVRTIVETVAFILAIHNDLVGVYKDVKRGEANFLTILTRQHGVGLQAACDLAGKIADDMVRSMIQMESDLPLLIDGYDAKKEAIDKYLHLGHSMIRGSFDWHMISNRYRDERYFSV